MASLTARYFRLYCYDALGSYYRIGEMEVRATAGGANICTGGTAFGNSDYYPSSRAFNGTYTGEGNVWAGNPGNGRTVGYDFGSAVSMGEFTIINSVSSGDSQHLFSFDFQTSDDGTTWYTQFSKLNTDRAKTPGASYAYSLETFAISGVVEGHDGLPRARKVVIWRESTNLVAGSTTSNAGTGAYSIQVANSAAHTVIAYPGAGDGLPALVLNGVIPV